MTIKFLSCLFSLLILLIPTGCAPSFLITPVSNTNALNEETLEPGQGLFPDKILVVNLSGTLQNNLSSGFLQASENPVSLFTQQLDLAANDSSIKAVLLRVNSPGGTVAASETLYQEILRFKSKTHKPVITYGQDLLASGAYYAACASDKIVAQPTSIVGSVGVIFHSVEISGAMSLVGVKDNTIKSGPMKDMASMFKPITPEEKAIMQDMVDDYFARFKGIVENARNLHNDKLAAVTDGRVFTGDKAVALGLIDQTGSLHDALNLAKSLANSPNAKVVTYKRPYGYSGSVYAQSPNPQQPQINLHLLPESTLQPGFFYIWNP